jgi:hypothetical protein
VKQEAKLPYLLECLQKTAPPVLIFAENKARGLRCHCLQHIGTRPTACAAPARSGSAACTGALCRSVASEPADVAPDTLGQADVDDIHERLLTVAVEAVSIHGGKDQEEREAAIQHFKAGTKVRAGAGGARGGVVCAMLPALMCAALRTVHSQRSGCDVRPLFACDYNCGLCAGCAGGNGRGIQGAGLPRHSARHQLRHAG